MSTSAESLPVHPVPTRADRRADAKRASSTRAHSGVRKLVFAGVALAVLGWGGSFALHAYRFESTEDAFVAGRLHTVSPRVDGQVSEVLVQDNQSVHAGDVLLRLDPLPFQLAVEKAKAAVAQAVAHEHQVSAAATQADATLAEARARVQQAEAQTTQTKAQAALSTVTLTRNEQLFRQNSAAQAELDQARSAAQAAAATQRAAEASLVAAQAGVRSAEAAANATRAETEAAHAAVIAATAAQHDAERELSYAALTATVDGRVGNRHVESGDRIQAGQALFALAENDVWVVANFKETQLAHMRIGQDVELEVDALPGETLRGKIESC